MRPISIYLKSVIFFGNAASQKTFVIATTPISSLSNFDVPSNQFFMAKMFSAKIEFEKEKKNVFDFLDHYFVGLK